jgi:hypothetical protein
MIFPLGSICPEGIPVRDGHDRSVRRAGCAPVIGLGLCFRRADGAAGDFRYRIPKFFSEHDGGTVRWTVNQL